MDKTFYISGKISGCKDLNKPKFDFTEGRLYMIYGTDIDVINPHSLPVDHDGSWQSYMKTCIKHLTRAHFVVVLDDWQKSRGAIIEVLIAYILCIPVIRLASYTSEDITISRRLLIKLLFKLFLNRFAHAKDYQPKQ